MITRHLFAGLALGAALLVSGCCGTCRRPAVVGTAPVARAVLQRRRAGAPVPVGVVPQGIPPTGAFAPPVNGGIP